MQPLCKTAARILSDAIPLSQKLLNQSSTQWRRMAQSVQARRLVKNSIIAVEAPDEEMNDEDWVEDPQEADDIIGRHRPDQDRSGGPSGSSAQGGGQAAGWRTTPHKLPPLYYSSVSASNNK